jgi:hypothetical protein
MIPCARHIRAPLLQGRSKNAGPAVSLGAEPAGGSPAEFGQFISSQLAYCGKVVKDSGMKMHQ